MSGTMATQCGSYLIPIPYMQQELLICFPIAILFMYIFDDIVFIERVTKVFLNNKISFLIDYALHMYTTYHNWIQSSFPLYGSINLNNRMHGI